MNNTHAYDQHDCLSCLCDKCVSVANHALNLLLWCSLLDLSGCICIKVIRFLCLEVYAATIGRLFYPLSPVLLKGSIKES
jgi:hypothetical protein